MKVLTLFIIFVVTTAGARPFDPIKTVTNFFEEAKEAVGDFVFGYKTSDGYGHMATGRLKNVGTKEEASEVSGSYVTIGFDGTPHRVTYIADENGYRVISTVKLGVIPAMMISMSGAP